MNLEDFLNTAPKDITEGFIRRTHRKGTTILFPKEKNQYLYILLKGTAEVFSQNTAGSIAFYCLYHPVSCFGELEIFHEDAETYDVRALTDCTTLALPKELLFSWMRQDFSFNCFLIRQLAEKLMQSTERVAALSLLSAKDRLIQSIYTHERMGDLGDLTKEQLCREISLPIRSLNRSIKECEMAGLFSYEKKQFHIKNAELLHGLFQKIG